MSVLTFVLPLIGMHLTGFFEQPAQKPIQVVLDGRVIDDFGKPIPDAVVKLWIADPFIRNVGYPSPKLHAADAASDSKARVDGQFIIRATAAKAAKLGVWVSAPGRFPRFSGWIRVDQIKSDVFGEINLSAPRAVSGRVVDRQGRAVSDAEVFHVGDSPGRPSTRTDPNGRFRLEQMVPRRTFVFARKDGFRFGGAIVPAHGDAVVSLPRRSEPGNPLRSRDWPLSPQQEAEIVRRMWQPAWRKAVAEKDDDRMSAIAWNCLKVDPWRVHEEYPAQSPYSATELMFRTGPEEALAAIESLAEPSVSKAQCYGRLCRRLRGADTATRIGILDRAVRHGRNAPTPEERCIALSGAAIALVQIGQIDAARRIVDEIKPIGESVADENTRGRFGVALGLFDPLHALAVMGKLPAGGMRWERYHNQLAYQLAERNPIVTDFILTILEYDGWKKSFPSAWTDSKAVALCQRMALKCPDHAISLARRRGDATFRALALATVARTIATQDRGRAVQLLDEAHEVLRRCHAARRRGTSRWLETRESLASAAMLDFAEVLSPESIEERLWLSLAMRMPAAADSPALFGSEFEYAELAVLLARFDKDVATVLAEIPETKCGYASRAYMHGYIWASLDPDEGVRRLNQLPDDGEVYGPGSDAKYSFCRVMGFSQSSRWEALKASFGFWTPEVEAADLFDFDW